MNYKKEKKSFNLALKSFVLNNKKKHFYLPGLNQSRNIGLIPKLTNNTSISKSSIPNIFIKKLPSKAIIPSKNSNYNTLNNNSLSKKLVIHKKSIANNIKKKELIKNKSYKLSIKKKITEKNSNNNTKTILKHNENNCNNKNELNNTIDKLFKNKNIIFNKYDIYNKSNEGKNNKINKNNTINNVSNINNDKNNNNFCKKEKKLFGIMLKKKSIINKNFINRFNDFNNNYYFYEKSLGNNFSLRNSSREKSFGSSLLYKNNKISNSNKLIFKNKLNNNYINTNNNTISNLNRNTNKNINANKKNSNDKLNKQPNNIKNEIIIDYFNDKSKKNRNTINYYINSSSSHLTNLPHLNRIAINNYNCKIKKPLKLNLIKNIPNKKIHLQNNNYNQNNNTININIDYSVNNIYDNAGINLNKNNKISYIKVNSNSNNKNIKKCKIKKNLLQFFPKTNVLSKNDSMNHSYQNIIINNRKRSKTKEKKVNKLGIIIKENLKKIHEKKKKKKLLISLNNIHLNKVKLLGIQEIFSNFSKINAKSPKFATPKIHNCYENFNLINFSGRFNRTEDKNIDFFTSMTEKYNNKKSRIKENPQYVYEYFYEILNNLLIDENNYFENLDIAHFNLLKNDSYINPDSRKFFINSLINIQELLNFSERTLFLTTQIFDRYINNVLMKKKIFIKEENLDIVIVTSLIIAAKNEEIKLYSMTDYLNLLPLKYNIHDLEKTEYEILSGFDFNLNIPSMLDFFELFSMENRFNKFQRAKGLYLLNFILLDNNLVQIPSSLIAYAVTFIVYGKHIQFNKVSEDYINLKNEKKKIKIISILKDREMLNNLCGYIKYIYNNNKNSIYDGPFNKFNNPNYYFISSYLDI